MGERAVAYRRINRIPDDWGTAVNVQQMVFGNKGAHVRLRRRLLAATSSPARPSRRGDFLANAQGEDVVSGVRTPRDLSELADWMPDVHAQLLEILRELERHYGDMQDTEFTVEEGRLYMLQTRNAKRPAQAAVRFAVDAVAEGLLDQGRGDRDDRRRARSTRCCTRPSTPTRSIEVSRAAWPPRRARPRARSCSRAPEAVTAAEDGRDVILVRPFTEADDVAGFHAAEGILTTEGGKASHAALVARGMGRPAVTGAGDAGHRPPRRRGARRRRVLREGDLIAIDGTTGAITSTTSRSSTPEVDARFETVLRLVRRAAHARRARQRRHAGGRASRARASAPRASGCAGPSTCSWPPTASRRCAR